VPHREPGGESLRGLTGAGASKVGPERAMRARDVSREPRERRPGDPQDTPDDEGTGDGSRGDRAHSVGGPGSSGSSPVDS
jgi:hypothetical protein